MHGPIDKNFTQIRKTVAVRIPYMTCRRSMILGTRIFRKHKKPVRPDSLIKPVQKCMVPPTKGFSQRRKTVAVGIPYETCRKPMVPGTRILPNRRKIQAVRIPYKTCRNGSTNRKFYSKTGNCRG